MCNMECGRFYIHTLMDSSGLQIVFVHVTWSVEGFISIYTLTFEMAAISLRSRSFEVKLPLINPRYGVPSFVGITKIEWEKVEKCFFLFI